MGNNNDTAFHNAYQRAAAALICRRVFLRPPSPSNPSCLAGRYIIKLATRPIPSTPAELELRIRGIARRATVIRVQPLRLACTPPHPLPLAMASRCDVSSPNRGELSIRRILHLFLSRDSSLYVSWLRPNVCPFQAYFSFLL